MHARALKTFNSKYGLIRKGTIFQPEPNYAKGLKKNNLIEDATAEDARKAIEAGHTIPGPGEQREDKSIPAAPHTKGPTPGKGDPGKAAPKPGSATAHTPGAGKGPQSSASDQDPASTAKTLTTSGAGGKRAITTPKRKRAVRQPLNPGKPAE